MDESLSPAEGLPVSGKLSRADPPEDPVFAGERRLLLRTRVTDRVPGKQIRIKRKYGFTEELVPDRAVFADMEENRQSELLLRCGRKGRQ